MINGGNYKSLLWRYSVKWLRYADFLLLLSISTTANDYHCQQVFIMITPCICIDFYTLQTFHLLLIVTTIMPMMEYFLRKKNYGSKVYTKVFIPMLHIMMKSRNINATLSEWFNSQFFYYTVNSIITKSIYQKGKILVLF